MKFIHRSLFIKNLKFLQVLTEGRFSLRIALRRHNMNRVMRAQSQFTVCLLKDMVTELFDLLFPNIMQGVSNCDLK